MPSSTDSQQPTPAVTIVPASAEQFARRVDELVDIHLAAMNYSPQVFHQRKALWLTNTQQRDFLCHVALLHSAETPANLNDMRQRGVGVCYSFAGSPNTWWYQQVFRGLRSTGHSLIEATNMLTDYAELSEVHVAPHLQGHGIGRALLELHLRAVAQPKVMLSTPEVPNEANGAWKLYRKLGFTDVLRNFHFPADDRPFAILERPTGR